MGRQAKRPPRASGQLRKSDREWMRVSEAAQAYHPRLERRASGHHGQFVCRTRAHRKRIEERCADRTELGEQDKEQRLTTGAFTGDTSGTRPKLTCRWPMSGRS